MGDECYFPFLKLKSYPIDMKPVLQSTKNVMKLKLKWKRKRLMIGCVNHRKSQGKIVKRPQTKGKRCCVGISNKTFYTQSPSSHPQSKINLNTMITCH